MRVREVIPFGKSAEEMETREREKKKKKKQSCGERGWEVGRGEKQFQKRVHSEISAVYHLYSSFVKHRPAATYRHNSLYCTCVSPHMIYLRWHRWRESKILHLIMWSF